MNFLYWNLKSNANLEQIIADCIVENNVDIALFSEYNGVDFNSLKEKLSQQFSLLESFGGCETVRVLHKNSIQLSLIQEQNRYLLANLHSWNPFTI